MAVMSQVDCLQPGSGGVHSDAYLEGDGRCAWCGALPVRHKLDIYHQVATTGFFYALCTCKWKSELHAQGSGAYKQACVDHPEATV